MLSGEQLIDQVQFVLLWLLCSLACQKKAVVKKKKKKLYEVVTLQQVCVRMHVNLEELRYTN